MHQVQRQLIGGPFDGDWIQVQPGVPKLFRRTRIEPKSYFNPLARPPRERTHTYFLTSRADGDFYYRHESIPLMPPGKVEP